LKSTRGWGGGGVGVVDLGDTRERQIHRHRDGNGGALHINGVVCLLGCEGAQFFEERLGFACWNGPLLPSGLHQDVAHEAMACWIEKTLYFCMFY
jgi:hypothetical protein